MLVAIVGSCILVSSDYPTYPKPHPPHVCVPIAVSIETEISEGGRVQTGNYAGQIAGDECTAHAGILFNRQDLGLLRGTNEHQMNISTLTV